MKFINKLIRDEAGATAIEYGLVVGVISVGLMTIMGTMSTSVKNSYTKSITKVDAIK